VSQLYKHRSVLGFVYLRSPGGSTVMFRYYLLGVTLRRQGGYTLGFAEHF